MEGSKFWVASHLGDFVDLCCFFVESSSKPQNTKKIYGEVPLKKQRLYPKKTARGVTVESEP